MQLEIIHTLFALTNRFAKKLKDQDPREPQEQMVVHRVLKMCSSELCSSQLCSSELCSSELCSSQLCEILCTIFNLSFLCGVVPDILKSSCIV